MMKRLLALGALLCASASAQTLYPFFGNTNIDSGRDTVTNATVTATPVFCPGATPEGYHLLSGGQVTLQTVTAEVSGGAFTMLLPDVAKTSPANMGFHVQIIDNTTGIAVLDYACVQPSPTAAYASSWCNLITGCDFDLYSPDIPAIPTVNMNSTVTVTGGTTGYVDVSTFPGNDLGAQIAAADAANTSSAVTLAVLHPGTISTQFTLSAQHALSFYAPVTFDTYITPTANNAIQCYGGVASTLTMGAQYSDPTSPDGRTPWFYSNYPASGSEVNGFSVRNCTFSGYGGIGAILDSAGPTQNVTMTGNTASYAWLYQQDGAPASNPTTGLRIIGNYCGWPTNIGQGACVLSYGANQGPVVENNEFQGYYGVELYATASDGSAAPNFPTLTEIQSTGLNGALLIGNHCGANVTACQWTSMANGVTMTGNSADECYDVCFDVEGGAHHLFTGNHCYATGNGCFTSFFTSFQNSAIANQVENCAVLLHIFNSSQAQSYVQDWDVSDNVSNCPTGSIWVYLDASQRTQLERNKIQNGSYVFTGGQSDFRYEYNHLLWTIAATNQAAAGGGQSPAVGGAGMGLPNPPDTLGAFAIGNTIETTVSQTLPCLSGASSNYNVNVTTTINGNTCLGPWGSALYFNNSSNNPSVGNTLILRNNGFSVPGYSFPGIGDSPAPTVQSFGNYNSATGAAIQ